MAKIYEKFVSKPKPRWSIELGNKMGHLYQFHIQDDDWRLVGEAFEHDMTAGLSRDAAERAQSSLQMENTFVTELLDGTESGKYIGLDLGGTNFRIFLIELRQGRLCNQHIKKDRIPTSLLSGTSAALFDYIASSIGQFLDEFLPNKDGSSPLKVPLGFTFSFPMHQKALDCGELITWTKTFKCQDGVGEDAVTMLRCALDRCDLGDRVKVLAVINDTTGTLAAGALLSRQCRIGIILGTGSNACYM